MPDRSVVTSTRVLVGDRLTEAALVVEAGRVRDIVDRAASGAAHDHGDAVIMPALVDTHVHVNEPGRTGWEGFDTATRAAASGGVAVIADMPLNSHPPTTDSNALSMKRDAARRNAHVDVAFWGGIVPGNLSEVAGLADAGVFGFKAFLSPSGIDEFPPIDIADLAAVLEATGAHGLPLLVHAESPAVLGTAPSPGPGYASYLASRPPEAEVEAIRAVVDAVEATGAPAHILHVSAAAAVEPIAAARSAGLPVSAETCPHYLTLTAEEVPDGDGAWKCAPPIREGANRDALWAALERGDIDMVVSDHSPCPADMKDGGFDTTWGGIASLELRLPVVWTEASRRGHGIADVARWLSTGPARLIGLSGTIEPGARADFVVWDPDAEFTVDPGRLQQRHAHTPYMGRRLLGRVRSTYVRGKMVVDDGRMTEEGVGTMLRRP